MKKWICILALSAATVYAQTATSRPNVLFIAVDDLKPLLGCYDDAVAKTPHMDRLAARGTTFLNAHCQQAVCGPSRASLLTGKRPDQIRVWDLKTKIRPINPGVVMLPEHFKAQGYETAALGKIYDPRSVDGPAKHDTASWTIPYQPSWQMKYDPTHGKPVTHYQSPRVKDLAGSMDAGRYDEIMAHLKANDAALAVESEDVPDNAYDDGAMTDRALEMLRDFSDAGKPFFLAVGFKKPHLPFVAPKKYWDLYDRAAFSLAAYDKLPSGSPAYAGHNSEELRNGYSGIPSSGPFAPELQRELIHGYYACVSYVDAQVGRLLDEVAALGLAENTIIVLWGDHGWHLGDHGLWCKHSNYEQATRVPLIMAAPGGSRITQTGAPVEFVDIYPTLCELAGIPAPDGLAGASLAPVISGKAAGVKDFAISQYPRQKFMGYALRTLTHRLVAWIPKTEDSDIARDLSAAASFELFDYEKDPLEKTNLADDPAYAETLEELKAKLTAFLQDQT